MLQIFAIVGIICILTKLFPLILVAIIVIAGAILYILN